MLDNKSMIDILKHYQPMLLESTTPSAAVMLILLENGDNPFEIVLTKRAATLPTYAGDYSFPGGMHDATDTDLYATAVREIHEELDLSPNVYQPIGQLDDFQDRYGNLVRPFVSMMNKSEFLKIYKLSAAEITEIYFFPLTKLNEIYDEPKLHVITRRRPSYAYTQGKVFVWGLTATLLMHLSNIISQTNQPVCRITRTSSSSDEKK